jgi:hypothetical protein
VVKAAVVAQGDDACGVDDIGAYAAVGGNPLPLNMFAITFNGRITPTGN